MNVCRRVGAVVNVGQGADPAVGRIRSGAERANGIPEVQAAPVEAASKG